MPSAIATIPLETVARGSDVDWRFTLNKANLTGATVQYIAKVRDGFGDVADGTAIFDNLCTIVQAGDGASVPAIITVSTSKTDLTPSALYRAEIQSKAGGKTVPLLQFDLLITDQVRQG